ncbi:MAG TPA: hypothetical protein VGN16_21080 [Acidobacteriaceae bacterium]|jgi:hypothetical protein
MNAMARKTGAWTAFMFILMVIGLGLLLVVVRFFWDMAEDLSRTSEAPSSETSYRGGAISPMFETSMSEYVDLLVLEHDSARKGYSAFQAATAKAEAKEKEMMEISISKTEGPLYAEAKTQALYSACADIAFRNKTPASLGRCEERFPVERLQNLKSEIASAPLDIPPAPRP